MSRVSATYKGNMLSMSQPGNHTRTTAGHYKSVDHPTPFHTINLTVKLANSKRDATSTSKAS
jgi:hypothetical protein